MPLPPLSAPLRQQLSLPADSKDLVVPHFAALYRQLSNNIINADDASSLAQNESYEEGGTEVEVRRQWIERARRAILIRSLREICASSGTSQTRAALLSSMKETGLIIADFLSEEIEPLANNELSGSVQNRDQMIQLLTGDIEEFRNDLDIVANNLGHHIVECEKTIREILSLLPDETLSTTTSSSTASRIPANASRNAITTARKHQLADNRNTTSADMLRQHISHYAMNVNHTLPTMLNNLTTTLQSLLSTQSTLLATQIHHLETFTHSTQSRNLITHTQFLTTVAKGIALKAQILSLLREKEIYAQEGMREALAQKAKSLRHEETELAQRERDLKLLLGEYDSFEGGRDTFRTLGAEYIRVEMDIKVVRDDIERLRHGENVDDVKAGTGTGTGTRRRGR